MGECASSEFTITALIFDSPDFKEPYLMESPAEHYGIFKEVLKREQGTNNVSVI